MDEFQRSYPLLSACGLNCGLCPRFHTEGASRCPGCGGEGFLTKRPACGVLSCCRRHGGIEYCFLCEEYPCKKYEGAACFDSFITHRHMRQDFDRAKREGLKAYQAALDEKADILRLLLRDYNDGRRKNFYCLAVNLLPLFDVRDVWSRLTMEIPPDAPTKEKAAQAVELFQDRAEKLGIELALHPKKSKKTRQT